MCKQHCSTIHIVFPGIRTLRTQWRERDTSCVDIKQQRHPPVRTFSVVLNKMYGSLSLRGASPFDHSRLFLLRALQFNAVITLRVIHVRIALERDFVVRPLGDLVWQQERFQTRRWILVQQHWAKGRVFVWRCGRGHFTQSAR